MKKNIKFECDVCGQKQVVEVSVLYGGGTLQIMIDRFFIMDVDFRNGEWAMLCNNMSWLTTDEHAIIVDATIISTNLAISTLYECPKPVNI